MRELKEYCSAIFIDVAKAFDEVWRDELIHKIIISLLKNFYQLFLSYRINWFKIKVKEFISEEEFIAKVPQGSVLGSILYVLFSVDIPTSEKVLNSTFADNTVILCRGKCPIKAINRLENHITLDGNGLPN